MKNIKKIPIINGLRSAKISNKSLNAQHVTFVTYFNLFVLYKQ